MKCASTPVVGVWCAFFEECLFVDPMQIVQLQLQPPLQLRSAKSILSFLSLFFVATVNNAIANQSIIYVNSCFNFRSATNSLMTIWGRVKVRTNIFSQWIAVMPGKSFGLNSLAPSFYWTLHSFFLFWDSLKKGAKYCIFLVILYLASGRH